DPPGLVTLTLEDALGRLISQVDAYDDQNPQPSATANRTTDYTYDGSDHVVTIQATLPRNAHETTQYVYGVTTAAGSDVNSNDLLKEVRWPDKTTGSPSSTDNESYTVNALGENKTYTDRSGSVHTYSFDVVGRPTADAVTTLA